MEDTTSSYLLKLGIAGVQEFISQSRKIRDLDAASRIVAALSQSAGQALSQAVSKECILVPAVVRKKDAWPHQIICRIHAGDERAVRAAADAAASAVSEKWDEIATDAFSKRKRQIGTNQESFLRAARDWLEVYWVAVKETGDYASDFDRVSQLYDGRRHTRTRSQPTRIVLSDGKMPWICSLCGKRPSVLKEGSADGTAFTVGRERLCAACATKRHDALADARDVPSTHYLAKHRFLTDSGFEAVRDQHPNVNWRRVIDTPDSDEEVQALPEKERDALSTLRQRKAFQELPSYYAIVVLDGDHMGKWLSGEKAGISEGEAIKDLQKELSSRIVDVSRKLTKLSQNPAEATQGVYVVYAGGDDALLLTAMDYLLPAIRKIRSVWEKIMGASWPPPLGSVATGPTLTLHASIAHAKSPLQPALRGAFDGLARAKRYGRDCFSVAVQTSGAPFCMLGSWDEFDKLKDAVQAFSDWRLEDKGTRPLDPKEVAERPDKTLPMKTGHSLLGANVFFTTASSPEDAQLWSEAGYDREIRHLFNHSGAKRLARETWGEDLLAWLSNRAKRRLVSDDNQPICGRELVESALKTSLFLARTLSWRGNDDQ
ncbi:MAG TPA: type III-B CRISPR-associated protein Cas10/Cmr2 [Candidatus Hydrogenedentes bacterium]|nr:type III-B CRISPR-associated protein Cas10/Cmr2 [Candidatus Hydrogenedentota bacterium]HPG70130.1 type III-B CRISPR-associated protein Cas10/Cmr2 [Candidatus Hydrogenedentota bacterium]